MKIKRTDVSIREITEKYTGHGMDADSGVSVNGLNGRLNIRPEYQRAFVYDNDKRNAVINTIKRRLPLGTMYWCNTGKNEYGEDTFEILDGQQRTVSICEYVSNTYSIDGMFFNNLSDDVRKSILDYKLLIYQCDGTQDEKLEWFKTINIAGKPLTDQELRNAVYSGPWVNTAKRYFSVPNRGADTKAIGKSYVNAKVREQGLLELALKWCSAYYGFKTIEEYMAKHQNDDNANQLIKYYEKVFEWVKSTFPAFRKEMKGLDWGRLFNENKDKELDPTALDERIEALLKDDEVSKRKGIWEYVLTGNERLLSLRSFSDDDKIRKYEEQDHKCAICHRVCNIDKMQGDHIKAWADGGRTTYDNLQMLCTTCNLKKSNK